MFVSLLLALATASLTPPAECADARALPAEADARSRRVACTIPERYRSDVLLAEVLGAELRLHDSAAWLTTDALKGAGAIGTSLPQGWEGRGWTTRRTGAGVRVDYVARVSGADASYASAELRLEPWGVVDAQAHAPPRALDPRQQRLLRARDLALDVDGLFVCTPHPPNIVAFEWEDADGPQILVFLLSAWVDDAPLGGFHMVRVDADATRVIDHFAQTKSCVVAPRDGFASSPGLVVSHLTSAAPTLFHVFLSLQYRKPIHVATQQNGRTWQVRQGRISLVDPDASQAESQATTANDQQADIR